MIFGKENLKNFKIRYENFQLKIKDIRYKFNY